MFLPRSLGLDAHSYGREQFYADVQAYIRFKTPKTSLAALIDPSNRRSPLNRIPRRLASVGRSALHTDPLSHELRLFGCLIRANLRDCVLDIRGRIEALSKRATERRVLVDDLRTALDGLLDDIDGIIVHFRGLRPAFTRARRPAWVQELYANIDEYVSLVVESYLTSIISRIDSIVALKQRLGSSRARLRTRIVGEQAHRREAGYATVLGEDGGKSYVYRRSALKKFVSSVLFLDISKSSEGRSAANLVAGFAAAVAMLFSTIAAIWSQSRYGLNSFAFVFAIVVSYVFKDRIKEWLRTYFSSRLGRFLPDHSLTIRDPVKDLVVGRCREAFSYVQPAKLPPEVYECRHADARSVLEPETKPEIVIKYVKNITIRGRRIAEFHGRMNDVNDIIRFNVSSFLARMDDPIRRVDAFDAELDEVRSVDCPKAYHLNVVMVLKAADREATMERFGVILDKTGIQELQEVELPPVRALRAGERSTRIFAAAFDPRG